MSIDHLLDSTCRIWLHVEGATSLEADHKTVAATEACYLSPVGMDRQDTGAGQRDIGRRWMFLKLTSIAAVEDVLEIVTGPDAGSTWRVVEPPQHPRSHHTEAHVEPWNGVLPAVVAS